MKSGNIMFGIIFIVIGVFLILAGFRKSIKCSGRTVGRITGIREDQDTDSDGNSRCTYCPEFEYEINGQIYKGTGSVKYSKRRKIKIGSDIKIRYNPDKPEQNFTKGGGFILPFIGIMTILVGVICIFSANNG